MSGDARDALRRAFQAHRWRSWGETSCSCGEWNGVRDHDGHLADAVLSGLAEAGLSVVRLEQVGVVCEHGALLLRPDLCARGSVPVFRIVDGGQDDE